MSRFFTFITQLSQKFGSGFVASSSTTSGSVASGSVASRSLVFILLIVTAGGWVTAQTYQPLILKGRIVSAATGDGIAFATITVGNRGINTMTNESGDYQLKLPNDLVNDSLHITHVGYFPMTVKPGNIHLLIKLKPKATELEEVVVRSPDALGIIKKAIARIPDNYASTPHLLNGFYRLTGIEDKKIIQMSEAAFQIYAKDHKSDGRQVKLLKARFDKDLTAYNGNDGFDFGTSPEGLLGADIVSFAKGQDFINEDGLNRYTFTYRGVTNYGGAEAHIILFDQKDGIKKSLFQGKVIIDAETLAFLDFSFRLSPKGIKHWSIGGAKKLILSLSRIRIDMLQDSNKVIYKKFGNKYYLNYIYGSSFWHMAGGRNHFEMNPLNVKYHYLVTSIDTSAIMPFAKNDVMKPTKFLEMTVQKNISDSIDPFWKDYNLILPDFDVDSAARIIHANNETINHKSEIQKRLLKIKGSKSDRIDSIITFYHTLKKFNGSALVSIEGKTIYDKSFGLSDRKKMSRNGPNTQFRIGSTSKPFTSMLILQLVDEKKLSLTDSVGKILPGFIHGNITIEQLLTHQSGVPNYTNNEEYLSRIMTKKYGTAELVKEFCSDSLEFVPGSQFHYSNAGYVLLAAIIEKITGTSYSQALQARIFDPAGMKHSYFGSSNPDSASTDLAIGYVNEEPEILFPVENIAGAGGITSTATDLLRWNQAITSGSLLSSASTKAMFEKHSTYSEWDSDYGYGWMLDKGNFAASKKHIIQFHPGTEPGFHTMMLRQPDKNITIILLSNKGEFSRFDITDLLLNELN